MNEFQTSLWPEGMSENQVRKFRDTCLRELHVIFIYNYYVQNEEF